MSRQSIFRPVYARRYLHCSVLHQITEKLYHGRGDTTRCKQISNLNKQSKVKDKLIRYCLFRTDWLISYLIVMSSDTVSQLRTARFCDVCLVRAKLRRLIGRYCAFILLCCHRFPAPTHWMESGEVGYEKSSVLLAFVGKLSSLTHGNCRHVLHIIMYTHTVQHCMESNRRLGVGTTIW